MKVVYKTGMEFLFRTANQKFLIVAALAILASCGNSSHRAAPLKNCGPPIRAIRVIHPTGWAAHWSHPNQLIAFNDLDPDGHYRIFLMDPSGGNQRRFSATAPNFPSKTAGSPNWHPSGKYLAFAGEKETHPGSVVDAAPGYGGYCDLWVTTADGLQAWQLTEVPNDADHGTIIPVFSPDGHKLLWTERTAAPAFNLTQVVGYWVLKVADFVETPAGPHLENIQVVQPGSVDAFNESGGFNPDSQDLLLSSNYLTRNFLTTQIYRLDLGSGAIVPITQGDYNEHPRYTPDGRIVWMTSREVTNGAADWWLASADGTAPVRLSFFNEPGHPESQSSAVWPGPIATENWSDDGSFLIGEFETDLIHLTYQMIRVDLTCLP